MKIGQRFNKLTKKEYFHYIDNYKKYTDFNRLGMYRSILENEKLNLDDQKEVLAYLNQLFAKSFEFLQVKDPWTYLKLQTLGEKLDRNEEWNWWKRIRLNQEKILKEKRIKHRNFGEYSKHNCGFDTCPLNGIMVRQGTRLAECHMWFETDKREPNRVKIDQQKKNRKNKQNIIKKQMDLEM